MSANFLSQFTPSLFGNRRSVHFWYRATIGFLLSEPQKVFKLFVNLGWFSKWFSTIFEFNGDDEVATWCRGVRRSILISSFWCCSLNFPLIGLKLFDLDAFDPGTVQNETHFLDSGVCPLQRMQVLIYVYLVRRQLQVEKNIISGNCPNFRRAASLPSNIAFQDFLCGCCAADMKCYSNLS